MSALNTLAEDHHAFQVYLNAFDGAVATIDDMLDQSLENCAKAIIAIAFIWEVCEESYNEYVNSCRIAGQEVPKNLTDSWTQLKSRGDWLTGMKDSLVAGAGRHP